LLDVCVDLWFIVLKMSEDSSRVFDSDVKDVYKFGRVLGKGGYATVRKGTHKETSSVHAVKIIHKTALNKVDIENLKTEISLLLKVDHPNVVQTKEVYNPPGDPDVYIVMELMEGGELFDRIVAKDRYSEHESRVAFFDIVNAVLYCHEQGIVHRDLKPENLLYSSKGDDAVLKLADFGLAKMLQHNQLLTSACGTPGYVAPEMLKKKSYGKEVDMWSLGVILYILVAGYPPFYQEDHNEMFRAICAADYDFPSPEFDDVGDDIIEVIQGLMCVDPSKRMTCKDVLASRFMTKENVSTVHRDAVVAKMKSYNARRRFKKGILAVQIATMMGSFGAQKRKGGGGLLAAAKASAAAVAASTETSDSAPTTVEPAPSDSTASVE
jgi:calcium/calmodulin-dependent protein kinase I